MMASVRESIWFWYSFRDNIKVKPLILHSQNRGVVLSGLYKSKKVSKSHTSSKQEDLSIDN